MFFEGVFEGFARVPGGSNPGLGFRVFGQRILTGVKPKP